MTYSLFYIYCLLFILNNIFFIKFQNDCLLIFTKNTWYLYFFLFAIKISLAIYLNIGHLLSKFYSIHIAIFKQKLNAKNWLK